MANPELANKIALVTGASRGIGKAIAQALVQQGYCTLGTATTDAGAQAISDYMQQLGGTGKGLSLNVNDPEATAATLAAVKEEFGAPLILINNAGITRDNLALRMKDDEWQQVIDTNLNAVYRLIKLCLKDMTKARWGRIISISSVVAASGNPGQINYSAAKAGLEGLSRSLARELGSRGICVNTVAPGYIETDMTKDLAEAQRDKMLTQIPLGRMGKPEDIAAAVAFLVGAGGDYITGATIPVNGGMYM